MGAAHLFLQGLGPLPGTPPWDPCTGQARALLGSAVTSSTQGGSSPVPEDLRLCSCEFAFNLPNACNWPVKFSVASGGGEVTQTL